jgi:hypothetical protein
MKEKKKKHNLEGNFERKKKKKKKRNKNTLEGEIEGNKSRRKKRRKPFKIRKTKWEKEEEGKSRI